MDIIAAKRIDDLEKELKARGEILEAITKNISEGNCWLNCADLDWQQRTRDFANDSENHQITYEEWGIYSPGSLTLFLSGNFATAYYNDAGTLWQEADDERPMYHVMVDSDRPHRTCIHLIHLVNWICHLAGKGIPVEIVDMQFVGE